MSIPPPYLEEVSPGIFVYVQPDGSWFLNNAGFLVGSESVVAVDTVGTEKRAHAFREALERTTPHPVQALINTHAHGDHTHGNFAFWPQTAVIGHERARREILHSNAPEGVSERFPTADFGQFRHVPPMVTFTDRMSVHVDTLEVQLTHLGPAHTTNDVVAWIPERRVLFAGDLAFNGGTPFAMAGSVLGWLDILPALRAFEADVVVPGHGPVCGMEVFDTVETYLRWVADLARGGHADGVPPLEVAQSVDLGQFADLTDPERLVGNLHRAYADLEADMGGAPRGGALADPVGAFDDMIVLNGGKPLNSHA
ncbi:MAG: MBL fold metallo-hydrolase [Dehalococcoidia bacterium]|nr:MBL fold metallo-hydrolase [Dehalococcoidia bacterium]